MTPSVLLATVRATGCRVAADLGRLRLRGPVDRLTDDVRQQLGAAKVELLAILAAEGAELEQLLASTQAEVERLTDRPTIRRAVRNLLDDVRQFHRDGRAELALGLARDYATRFPRHVANVARPAAPPGRISA